MEHNESDYAVKECGHAFWRSCDCPPELVSALDAAEHTAQKLNRETWSQAPGHVGAIEEPTPEQLAATHAEPHFTGCPDKEDAPA